MNYSNQPQQQPTGQPATPRFTRRMGTWGIVIAVIAVLFIGGCSSYNGLNSQSLALDEAWAQVQVQYQRRADLIPNLVNSVKGYSAHESSTLERVTDARAGLLRARDEAASATTAEAPQTSQDMDAYMDRQDRLGRAMGLYINAVHEAYPDLKANTLFQDLQTQLEGTENRIATERGRYTQAVKEYNLKVTSFPARLWAGAMGFQKRPQFQASAQAQDAPVVQF